MATGAANPGPGVRRPLKVRVRPAMAAQAGLINLFRRHLADLLNLGDIAAAFDVSFAGPMAALASRSLATV